MLGMIQLHCDSNRITFEKRTRLHCHCSYGLWIIAIITIAIIIFSNVKVSYNHFLFIQNIQINLNQSEEITKKEKRAIESIIDFKLFRWID